MATYSSFKKIDSDAIVDGTITSNDLGSGQVTDDKINAGQVTTAKFADSDVSSEKLNNTLDISTKNVTYRPIVNADINNSAGVTGGKLASSAAVDNLGYTPVSTSGDTMSGTLQLPAGSTSSPAVRGNDANTGLYFPGGDQVGVTINGNESMYIDSNARVRFTRKPAFAAVGTAGWLYANSYGGTGEHELGSIMGWTLSHEYGGSNFSTNNGRFTAPVAGYYHFSTMWYFLNDTNGTNSYVYPWFRRNGSSGIMPGNRQPYPMAMHGNRDNYDDGANYNTVMYMNAGQYCSLGIRWHATNSRHHAGHQIFSGQLIG